MYLGVVCSHGLESMGVVFLTRQKELLWVNSPVSTVAKCAVLTLRYLCALKSRTNMQLRLPSDNLIWALEINLDHIQFTVL